MEGGGSLSCELAPQPFEQLPLHTDVVEVAQDRLHAFERLQRVVSPRRIPSFRTRFQQVAKLLERLAQPVETFVGVARSEAASLAQRLAVELRRARRRSCRSALAVRLAGRGAFVPQRVPRRVQQPCVAPGCQRIGESAVRLVPVLVDELLDPRVGGPVARTSLAQGATHVFRLHVEVPCRSGNLSQPLEFQCDRAGGGRRLDLREERAHAAQAHPEIVQLLRVSPRIDGPAVTLHGAQKIGDSRLQP